MIFGLDRLLRLDAKLPAGSPAADTNLEAVIYGGAPDEEFVDWSTRSAERKHFICAIRVQIGAGWKFGTGVLVGPDLVLTNYHVVAECVENPAADFVRGLRCKFDYFLVKRDAPPPAGRDVPLAVDWCVAARRFSPRDIEGADTGRDPNDLDYALLRLERSIGLEPLGEGTDEDSAELRGWEPFPSPPRLPLLNETIAILHHPVDRRAKPPQIPLRRSENKIVGIVDNNLRVRHDASTAPGSSGSPCFGRNDAFLALHHGADRVENGAAARWNQSIPMTEITRDLADRNLGAILSARPPDDSDIAPQPAVAVPADRRRVAAGLAGHRMNVARILLDRNRPETEVVRTKLGNRIVHLVVCREIDRHLRFLERLTQLSLMLPSLGLRTAQQRLDLLKSAERTEPGWSKIGIERPPRERSDERRIADVLEQIGPPDTSGKRWLVEIVTRIDDCSFDSEKTLVTGLAAQLAAAHSPAALQVFFVYHDPVSTPAADNLDFKRRQFAAMWSAEAPPPGCGAAFQLDDVGPSDLAAWSSDIGAAWQIDETELRRKIELGFAGAEHLPMSEVEQRLDELIKNCAEAVLGRS
jgi:hypothetical protein